ncbi:BRCT domain-containing protein [Trypanosoma grayi]|uniref:BRCT domain-containing protein n=1 Tax=Trypanosoma grayi TaxID=71804 RepID=UPI0004F4A200|nr:BRCT domain-containing protein [Trypanosoma grayi]KEG12252.1 BRCT domain-containing protein [Trypanosoma grayi]
MNTSRATYEKDLPEDLLELIDHTTRGVQRLYESTKQAEGPIGVRGGRQSAHRRTDTRQTDRTDEFDRVTRSGAASNAVSASLATMITPAPTRGTAAGYEETLPSYANTSGSNGIHQSAESSGTNTARRWMWSRAQALPTSSNTDGHSGTSTANTTISMGVPRRATTTTLPPPPPPLHAGAGLHNSTTSTVNTSATGVDDYNSSSQRGQGWKDAFKSLLSVATAPTTTAAATPMSGIMTTNQQERVTQTTHDSAAPPGPTVTEREYEAHRPLPSQSDATLEHLQRQLRKQEASHQEKLSQLRVEHNSEIAQLRRDALEARQKAEDEISSQIMASFNVKQKLLRAEMESERARADEAHQMMGESQKTIERLRKELEAGVGSNLELQERMKAKEKQITELRETLSNTRKQLATREEELAKHSGELGESKRREKLVTVREQEALDLVKRLESQLREQQERSREELRRLEAEFHSTTTSYQQLIGEATEKLAALERVERKYRALKEQHRQQKQQQEALASKMASVQEEKRQLVERIDGLHQDVEALRLQLARKEHEMREERASHHQIVEGITKRLEDEGDNTSREKEELQKAVRHAEECVLRLQREVEGLTHQLHEEQAHSKELLVKLEQSALRHQEDLTSARRAASTYQQQSEGVLSSLKRQLREKDAKLEALATTASEPIQRLRSQLEDERSRRANLEEQFNRYKQKAKAAEEAALREIRREQHRATSAPRSQGRTGTVSASLSPTRGEERRLPTSAFSPSAAAVPARETGTTTPMGQRILKIAPPLPPCSYNRSRERNSMTPPQLTPARAAWDSVGSISNISCSSPLYSSREGDAEGAEYAIAAVDPPRNATPEVAAHLSQVSPPDNIGNRMAQHEQLLQEFHQSAAEVFRKITGNRDEFLATCASVVRAVSHHSSDGESAAAEGMEDAAL